MIFFQMSEDLAKQLASYKAQLQQVEAALTGNGDNEDLLKLKKDLQVGIRKSLHFACENFFHITLYIFPVRQGIHLGNIHKDWT